MRIFLPTMSIRLLGPGLAGVIVGGNHSARGHAPEWIHHVERGLQMLSAYVLKVDINPSGAASASALVSCPQVL